MDREAGNDLVRPSGQAVQHGRSVSGIDRLAEDRSVADYHRVAANEPATRYLAARGNGKGLGFAEPNDVPLGGFSGKHGLVDGCRNGAEGNPDLCQQFPAPGRRRRQHDL